MVQSAKMYAFYFALWQLIIIAVTGKRNELVGLASLTLNINIEGLSKFINLTRVDRVLANKFLPVWITTDNYEHEFNELGIMDKVGEFTTFHDDYTKSAIVYFHDRLEIDGVIDVTYYIKGQPIDDTKGVHVVEHKYLHRVKSDGWLPRLDPPIDDTTIIRRRDVNDVLTIYPELLITINHDTYMAIEQDSDLTRGIATVSHILTVYNAADMLYSLISSSNIQLNIAGIVIEGTANQWSFESLSRSFFSLKCHVNAETIHSKISKYFWIKQIHFPRHSYDIIIYHSRSMLMNSENQEINGQSHTPNIEDFMFPPNYYKNRLSAVIEDYATYQHFTTIAHELAHIFGGAHDGEGDFGELFDMETCGNTLMASFSICSKSCLHWSPQTEAEIAEHLRRPAYCNLVNYPRSLDVPEPKIIFSAKAQCKCYGYESKLGPEESILENECRRPLECMKQETKQVLEVPLPMDGTPCGSGKVCWNGVCRI